MKIEHIQRILDGVAGIRKDGAAWLVPEDVDVTVFIGLPSEVMGVPRVARAEAAGELLVLETHKGERYYFAIADVAGVKHGPGEKRSAGRGAGFR
jgi:hypothetical protein